MIAPTQYHARLWLRRNPSAVPSWIVGAIAPPPGNRAHESGELDRIISERGRTLPYDARRRDVDISNAVPLYRSIYARQREGGAPYTLPNVATYFVTTARDIMRRYACGTVQPGDTRQRWRIARNYLARTGRLVGAQSPATVSRRLKRRMRRAGGVGV